jgi:hypothetical protein
MAIGATPEGGASECEAAVGAAAAPGGGGGLDGEEMLTSASRPRVATLDGVSGEAGEALLLAGGPAAPARAAMRRRSES